MQTSQRSYWLGYDKDWIPPLVQAHAEFLRDAHELLRSNSASVKGVGLAVSVALEMHLLQLGRGLQILTEAGYAEVGESSTRAMVSAAVNVLAIVKTNSDRVALQYLMYSVQRRHKYLANMVKNGLLTQDQATAYESTVSQRDQEVLSQYKERGIEPADLGGDRKDTWSTLSDRSLFEYAGALPWYEVHYVPLSDGAHASVPAVAHELMAMREGALVVGPRWTDPLLLVSTSVDVLGGSFVALIAELDSSDVKNAEAIHARARDAVQAAFGAAAKAKSEAWPPI